MKILVLGLETASPELLFGDDRLATIRSLMEIGCHGRLEGVVPAEPLPGWLSLATGRAPGSLGVYGDRARVDRSYKDSVIVDPQSIAATLWDQIAREGGKSILVGGPFDPAPESEAAPDLSTGDRAALRDALFAAARDRFEDLHGRLEEEDWTGFQFIEPGLDRVQRAFWRDHDPEHPLHEPNGRFADVVRDYYLLLDQEIAGLLDRLSGQDVAALIVSPRGVQRARGGVRINEWLIREGLLSLRTRPEVPRPFSELDVDWSRTKVWSEGGADARIHLNVKGREPEGIVDPADCRKLRDDLKARLEAAASGLDGAVVFKPEEIYRNIRGAVPDLFVEFGGGSRLALDDVGAGAVLADVGEAGPNQTAPTRRGAFVLASTALAAVGELDDARLIDLAPTLLQLAGLPPLPDAQGRSLLEGRDASRSNAAPPVDDDELVRERLRGLGYIG